MKLTKRNHYNPCFWIALWNDDYYSDVANNIIPSLPPRDYSVFSLSVKSGRMHKTKVDKVHYDKNLGVAEISRNAIEKFVKKYYPNKYEEFILKNKKTDYPVYLDFEEILTALENMPPYKVLLDVGKKRKIETIEEKAFLGCFLMIQQLRSHVIMNAMIQFYEELQEYKFEHFITLKWMLSDPNFLFSLVAPLIECRWTLFAVEGNIFPLCDSPILVKSHSIMVAISPQLLLEIERNVPNSQNICDIRNTIDTSKYDEFRRRMIGNTFREIVGSEEILKKWKNAQEFTERAEMVKNLKSYNRLVRKDENRELWHINAYGCKD